MTESRERPEPEATYFRVCSTCRKPIAFGADYYRCSVSTCNRPRTALFFCSVPCWDAHLPEARHRDAWAEAAKAPTREAFEAERREQELQQERERQREVVTMDEGRSRERKIVGAKASEDVPQEVLVVVSKLKAYIRARSGMNTSDGVVDVLSDHLRRICDQAIQNAESDGRKTVLDRDFKALFKSSS